MVIWRQRAFTDCELYADLALGTTGRTDEMERSDTGRFVGVFGEVLERDTKCADQGLGGL